MIMLHSWIASLKCGILKFNFLVRIVFITMMVIMPTSSGTTCSKPHETIIRFDVRFFPSMARRLILLRHRTFRLLLLSILTISNRVIDNIVALIVKEFGYVVLNVLQRFFSSNIIDCYTPLSVPKVMGGDRLESFLTGSVPYLEFYWNLVHFHQL